LRRILIVDDSPIVLAAARQVLVEAGFDVETRSGVEEIAEKGAIGFDLILMDVQLPQMFGDDIASILRNDRGVRTPIYLFSTLSDAELSMRTREAGVDGYISKDIGMGNLVTEVRRILDAV
jgi:DNA-binding response OmpR family regulator